MKIRDVMAFLNTRKKPAAPVFHPLEGDRCLEWGWTIDNLPTPPARVLDIGCAHSITAGVAAFKGLQVTGIDLGELGYRVTNLDFVLGDATRASFPDGAFDCVVLCSTIEHVGLAGRYESPDVADGDLKLMADARRWLRPGGIVIVTIPVGLDAVFYPMHRVYGEVRLPRVLEGLVMRKEEYWMKVGRCWMKAEKDEALTTQGRADFYSLGLMVLEK